MLEVDLAGEALRVVVESCAAYDLVFGVEDSDADIGAFGEANELWVVVEDVVAVLNLGGSGQEFH